jgi:hypothetical protein
MEKEVPKFEPLDEKCRLLREGNISLVLDSYNDIFSDFDPRPYTSRALSDDFLSECKRAARDKEAGVELRLLIPKTKRNLSDEAKIKKRLKNHFEKHFEEKANDLRNLRKEGFTWFFLGVVVMMFGAYLLSYHGFIFNLLIIIAEPAGWFLFWEGLDHAVLDVRKRKPDFDFYKRMALSQVYFFSY